jgi:hypothetical protein
VTSAIGATTKNGVGSFSQKFIVILYLKYIKIESRRDPTQRLESLRLCQPTNRLVFKALGAKDDVLRHQPADVLVLKSEPSELGSLDLYTIAYYKIKVKLF